MKRRTVTRTRLRSLGDGALGYIVKGEVRRQVGIWPSACDTNEILGDSLPKDGVRILSVRADASHWSVGSKTSMLNTADAVDYVQRLTRATCLLAVVAVAKHFDIRLPKVARIAPPRSRT